MPDINIIETRLRAIEEKFRNLEADRGKLRYPLGDNETRNFLKDSISDEIFNAVWDSYFYMHARFEDHWDGISLATTASAGNAISANLTKTIINAEEMFNHEIRFRSTFTIPASTNYNFTMSIGSGGGAIGDRFSSPSEDITYKHFGFFAKDSKLYATSSSKDDFEGVEEKLFLMDLETSPVKRYNVEVRFIPKKQIAFYVSDAEPLGFLGDTRKFSIPKLRTVFTNPLTMPSGAMSVDSSWILLRMQTHEAVLKNVIVDFFEYIHKKPKLPVNPLG